MLRKEATSQPPGDDLACQCYSPYYKWMNVSRVCIRWREIALDCSSLWTWLALDQRACWDFPKMVIERARTFPLDVMISITNPYIHCSPCMDMEDHIHRAGLALDLLADLVPRIRELVLFVDKDEPDGTWKSLTEPAELLEYLRIEAHDYLRYSMDATGPAVAALPTVLFASKTPRLHSLAVVGFDFELTNSLLHPGLRHLEITACLCGTFGQQSNLGDFLVALRRLPHLETLKVDWSVKALAVDSFEPVQLRELKLLRLSVNPITSKFFLDHLRLPRNASVRYEFPTMPVITVEQLQVLGQSCASLLDGTTPRAVWFGPIWPKPKHEPLPYPNASCRIWVADKRASLAGTPLESPWTALPPPQPRLIVNSQIPMIADPFVPSALRVLDLSAVHTVCLEDFAVGNKWARVLAKAQGVTSLRVLGEAAFGLPAALARGVPEDIAPWDKGGLEADEWHWIDFADDTQEMILNEMEEHMSATAQDPGEDVAMADTEETLDAAHGGDDSHNEDPVPPLFPRLGTIVFVGVNFAAPEGTNMPSHPDVHIPASVLMEYQTKGAKYGFSLVAFLKSLRIRRAQGASDLVRVEFEECRGVDVSQLGSLIQEGMEVWWDRERLSG
ncbi:hypothetical protein TRAPUB_9736 [Trametes pubescens]|uniref:F-box domain-containing protein n=1 Tax=Trametes pubescens TaxID=154538 RepID=A0A1M2W1Q5_TRAPU|nr:hypothetical protein TRAPUB_9736 [Trametes pubescens]